ncbi:hypothetical protein BC830DRAFT_1150352 [Chytriomyces sp. MP71]|nr:hypothetical protein BC830DRAFT_1150352 [Chytriomyces sp. MP71]
MSQTPFVQAMVIGTLFYGIAVGSSMYGIFSGISRFNPTKNARVMGTIIFCNTFLILEVVGFLWQSLGAGAGACVWGNYIQIWTYHLCMVPFDGFILYKAWLVSLRSGWVGAGALVCFLVRVVFGLWDSATSHGYIDAATGACGFSFSDRVLDGYMAADVLADLYGSVVTIASLWVLRDSNFSKVLMAENVTRSVVSLVQAVLYVLASQNDSVFPYANGIQMMIISQLLNSEFWWADTRHSVADAMKRAVAEDDKV